MNFTLEEVRQIVREVLTERKKHKKKGDGRILKRKYHDVEYKATAAGVKAAGEEDIEPFEKWADNPWAAKQAATIVKTGHPMRRKKKSGKSHKRED